MPPDDLREGHLVDGSADLADPVPFNSGTSHQVIPLPSYFSTMGTKGGQARTPPKKRAAKKNCAKAREAKARYRANPGLRRLPRDEDYGVEGS